MVRGLLACVGFAGAAAVSPAATQYLDPPWQSTTFAGYTGTGYDDGAAATATFNEPSGIAIDGAGNLYVADALSSTIRKLTPGGVVSTLAGTPGLAGVADGDGEDARFNLPVGLVAASDGTLYVADTGNHLVRKIAPDGTVSTVAGSAGEAGAVDATGPAARFNQPTALALDAANGLLYVADTGGNRIRRVVIDSRVVTTLTTGLSGPAGLALNTDGTTLHVAEQAGHTLRKIQTATGVATLLAGASGSAGPADGTGAAARFDEPKGLALDGAGHLYVTESNGCRVRRVRLSDGLVETLAGAYEQAGSVNGTGTAARLNQPSGLVHDAAGGRLVLTDTLNSQLRALDLATLAVTTPAGPPFSRGAVDGVGEAARFQAPDQLARDDAGNLYVADRDNHTLRKIAPDGTVTTLAGLAGNAGTLDGTGAAARFNSPSGVGVLPDGSAVYVSEADAHVVRKVTAAGVVTTLAGAPGETGSTDATGGAARFNQPAGLALDAAGNLFVAEFGNHTIRRITPAGEVTTLAGTPGLLGATDGTGGAARFRNPHGLAIDGAGNLFVADSLNQTIRRVTPAGVVSTYAGAAGDNGSDDADTAGAARFFYPYGVAVDAAGRVYVADYANHLIRRIGSDGKVRTLAGTTAAAGGLDGLASAARFRNPRGLAVSPDGTTVYVADTGNNAIRLLGELPVPVISSPAVASGAVGATFGGYQIEASRTPTVYGASNLPPGLGVDIETGLITGQPLTAGVYETTLRAQNVSGTGTALLTFTIAKGAASVVLGDLAQPFDGTPKVPSATTTPPGLDVTFTYDGSSTPPSAYGSYLVVAAIDDANYAGETVVTFDITAPVSWTVQTVATSGETLASPSALAFGPDGLLYIADALRHVVFRRGANGALTVFAGGLDAADYADGTGTAARFDSPSGLVFDAAGNLYVADSFNNRIRKITTAGVVTTLAGDGSPNGYDGAGTGAAFNYPVGLVIAPDGTALIVADSGNFGLRRVNLTTALVETLPLSSIIDQPLGVAVAADGTLFVTDAGGNNVRQVSAGDYTVNSLAGSGFGQSGFADGTGTNASFDSPRGLALSAGGNLYVLDTFNHTLRQVTPAGEVTTVAGVAGDFGDADGIGGAARFSGPTALVRAPDGSYYIADSDNALIRRALPPAVAPVFAALPEIVVTEGAALSDYAFSASGEPTAYAAEGLPPGLSLNPATGEVTGTPTASGVYAVTVSATNSLTTVESAFELTVFAPTWENWLAARFTSGELADAAVSGAEADPDGDGVANLLEYLMGGDPWTADLEPPTVTIEGGRIRLVYERLRAVSGWEITPEYSPDLFTWHRDAEFVDIQAPVTLDERFEQIEARAIDLLGVEKRQFMRLSAERQP
ncbi:MAG: SMP-30/gluconolactonase/LRE family protein [Verrucomicrobiota bacterium]